MGELFRVWCNDHNEWERHDTFVDGNGIMWHIAPYGLMRLKRDTHVVTWYTGLHDKYGVRIYESDIVAYKNKYIDKDIYMKVVFVDGAFLQNGRYEAPDIWYDWNEVAVVGNIYENEGLVRW